MNALSLSGCVVAALILPLSVARAETPDVVAAEGETLVAVLHAEGAQMYECKADASGGLAWQFREPIATLLEGGRTLGRHYAGPSWELADGSAVVGKVVGRTPGATPKDIPLLKLEVTSRRGNGLLADVATIQRLNTEGGAAEGPCQAAGAFLSVPYAADYAFYRTGTGMTPQALEKQHTMVPGDAIKWGPAPPSLPPGAEAAPLLGSPAKEGPFVLRLKFPAGFLIPPHLHSKDEFVVLLSGKLTIQSGEKVDQASLRGLPPGTFMHLPAGMAHYLWAETESVVQLNGVGPFDVKYIDPKDDPRNKPKQTQ